MKTATVIISAIILVVGLSVNLSRAARVDTPKKFFAQVDSNNDGKISSAEFQAYHMESALKMRQARFDQLDANNDGVITRAEFMDKHVREAEKIGKKRFAQVDKNNDGVLTLDEVRTRFQLIKKTVKQFHEE
jgi:Ca2+-binding EF-hand superfamily protein